MDLTVKERFLLLDCLPREGDISTLKIVRTLREGLSFSEEEHKEFEINYDATSGSIKWNMAKERLVEVKIGEKASDIIVEALKGLDKQKKLRDEYIPLWERFVEAKEKD